MLSLLVFFDRFIYYGFRSILLLYLIIEPIGGGLGWSRENGAQFLNKFMVFGYIFILVGGLLGDSKLGWIKTYYLGIILVLLGCCTMIFSENIIFLYAGTFLLLFGTNVSKSNITAMLGNLYRRNIILKDEGFSIYYVFVSFGALLSILLMSYISLQYDFISCFILLSISSIAYILLFQFFKHKLLFLNNKTTKHISTKNESTQFPKLKILLFVCICFLNICFWLGADYGFTALYNLKNDFSDVLKEISIFGNSFNMTDFQSIMNTFFIVILGMIVASYFTSRTIKSRKITPFYKISIGFLLMAISYIIIYFVLKDNDFVISNIDSAKLLTALLFLYALQSIAEMLITPIAISFVDTISSLKYKATANALYFFSTISLRLSIFMAATNDNEIILLKICFIYLLATVVILLCKDRLKSMTQTVLSK